MIPGTRAFGRHRSRPAGLAACLAFGLLAAALLLILPANSAWSADDELGKALFGQCKRCHQVGGGAEHRIGPQLNDVFGRAAGSLADFRYSAAMKAAGSGGLVWTATTNDRTDLLAWLRGFSGTRSDLSPAEPTATPEEYGLDPQLLTIRGDPEYGAYLAGECTICHQSDAADEGIPSIVGWPPDDFVIALHAYKRGKRVHPIMQLVAGRLSDEEIAALAAHFQRAEDDP